MELKTYEIIFHYTDSNGRLQKGADVTTATDSNSAIASVRAKNSWKCNNMRSFSVKLIK